MERRRLEDPGCGSRKPVREVGATRRLFEVLAALEDRSFDVSADGSIFYVNSVAEEIVLSPIRVHVNWAGP